MSSWLQAQLKAAENLLEAVDRTVSATTGATQQPNAGARVPPGDADAHDAGHSSQSWQQPSASSTQGVMQHGSPLQSAAPLIAANVSKGLHWLQGSPKPGGSPTPGSPAHPGAAPKQPQQPLWQPFVPQSSGSLSGPGSKLGPQPPSYAAGSPAHSRASPAATPPSSVGSYTTKLHGPFSSSATSSLQPFNTSSGGSQPAPHQANGDSAPVPAVPAPWQAAAFTTMPHAAVGQANAAADPAAGAVPAPVAEGTAAVGGAAAASKQPFDSAAAAAVSPEAAAVMDVPTSAPSAAGTDMPADVAWFAGADTASSSEAQPVEQHQPDEQEAQQPQQQQQQQQEHQQPEQQQDMPAASLDGTAAGRQADTVAAAELPAAEASTTSSQSGAVSAAAPDTQQGMSGASSAEVSSDIAAASSAAAGAAPAPAATAAAAAGNPSAKETQLTRLVETLRKRLEVVRGENQQLEDMLHEAEQRSSAEQATIAKLTADLTSIQREQEGLVSSAAANAAAQDAHIGRLQAELESSSRQVAALHADLQAAQEQHAQALSSKDSMEGGALEALRAEVATYEGQLEAERRAHAATKAAAATRERDLEEQLGSSSGALASIQRQLDEASSRAREAEEQQLLAAAEAARLQQQVLQLSQQQSPGHQPDPHLQLQLEAEREALQRRIAEAEAQAISAMQAQRAAEGRVAELQGEVAHLHSSYQAQAASRGAPQLEQQLRELQELLYQKQQQMEQLSGEKQAQQLMLERQITSLKSELGKAHAAAAAVVTGVHMRSSHDIIPMDALGEPYQRLARHNKLGGAVKATANFLDTTAASAAQLLRQQPLARLIVFLYIVLIHLYVYFLLARMQKQALLLLSQDHATGVGPEHVTTTMQAPPAPVAGQPLPPVGQP